MAIQLKRVYDPPSQTDGFRILVDRLWPRGLSKDTAQIDLWLKDAAPSTELRRQFHKDTSQWATFRNAYLAELRLNKAATDEIVEKARREVVTLLYASADMERNHAQVLREYLQRRLR